MVGSNLQTIICIMGPTAVGKTALVIQLSEVLPLEVISVDSRQIYKDMDIGTGKPTQQELKKVKHHLVDICNPNSYYSAFEFSKDAKAAFGSIRKRNKRVVCVGGTGLYFKAMINGIFEQPLIPSNVREELKAEAMDSIALYKKLQDVDPEAASKIHPNDLYRTIRALEVFYVTGKTISNYRQEQRLEQGPTRQRYLKIGLTLDRKILYERINRRVEKMIETGFLEEVKKLLESGYGENAPGMQAVGYRQLVSYLQGKCSLDEAVGLIKRDTRHYAKRQMTWFGADKEIRWFQPNDYDQLLPIIKDSIR